MFYGNYYIMRECTHKENQQIPMEIELLYSAPQIEEQHH